MGRLEHLVTVGISFAVLDGFKYSAIIGAMEDQSAFLAVVFQIGELDSEVETVDDLDLALLDGKILERRQLVLELVVNFLAFSNFVRLESTHDHVSGTNGCSHQTEGEDNGIG